MISVLDSGREPLYAKGPRMNRVVDTPKAIKKIYLVFVIILFHISKLCFQIKNDFQGYPFDLRLESNNY